MRDFVIRAAVIKRLHPTPQPNPTPPHIFKRIFVNDFFNLINISLLPYLAPSWQYFIIGSHIGVAPIRRQAHTW